VNLDTPFSVTSFDQFACNRPIVIEMNTEHQLILMVLAVIATAIAIGFSAATKGKRKWPRR
jgi:hypothetical protein